MGLQAQASAWGPPGSISCSGAADHTGHYLQPPCDTQAEVPRAPSVPNVSRQTGATAPHDVSSVAVACVAICSPCKIEGEKQLLDL